MRIAIFLSIAFAACARADDLAAKLKELADKPILPKDFDAPSMLSRDVRARLKEANRRDYEAWQKVQTKEDWEKFRDERIAALKTSLGEWPEPPKDMKVRVTKTMEGDAYKIENTLFESRPGLWVTANVYQPAKPLEKMPGILIVHSHHNPKHEGELQDMGVSWAKAGCYVLVMDQLGHGERRIHPFTDTKSYPEPFKLGRQDYYFRYNLGIQLSLIGESLIGWMAWDLMRGVDLLLKKPGIDPEKIILLGAVAGGGDPAAVTAALDPRIKCVVPFNFGGPQPETRFPLPESDKDFNYVGSGSWESTRNLRNSAKDGFLPWVICASIAPRHLIHAHEFSWDRERDPVWKRYQKVWGFYNATDNLSFATGKGLLSGRPPEASHCNNIGPLHRENIHKAFEKWFGIKAVESYERRTAEDLRCWTEELQKELKPWKVNSVAGLASAARMATSLTLCLKQPKGEDVEMSRNHWAKLFARPVVKKPTSATEAGHADLGSVRVAFIDLKVEREIYVPLVLITPAGEKPAPCVIAICQGGHSKFLTERHGAVAKLVSEGIAVCLADVRGTGETSAGSGRGRSSAATSLSSSEQMMGGSTFEGQLRDLCAVCGFLGERPGIEGKRLACWGESFADVNDEAKDHDAPLDAEKLPRIGEPGMGNLSMTLPLYVDGIKAVLSRGGTFHNAIVLSGYSIFLPHDALLPGIITSGDWHVLYGVSCSPAIRVERSIDAQNRSNQKQIEPRLRRIQGIRSLAKLSELEVLFQYSPDEEVAAWFNKVFKD